MRFFFLLFIATLTAFSEALHLNIDQVTHAGTQATTKSPKVHPGISGYVIRHFSPDHSAIIAKTRVLSFHDGTASLSIEPFDELKQSSLPDGNWQPKPGDEVILASRFNRALLIAPNHQIWRTITSRMRDVQWIHPDLFAAFLSRRGHPTPLGEDMSDFCSISAAGLLYLFLDATLFTLDCSSLRLIQITDTPFQSSADTILPFYSRIDKIDANWFGSGSSRLTSYAPYYFELMVENNRHSRELYHFIQSHDSTDKQLLDEFDFKETP